MGEILTTSLRIDDDIWTKFKLEAVKRKTSYTELLGEVLTDFLKK